MPRSILLPALRATPSWVSPAAVWAAWPDDDAVRDELAAALALAGAPVELLVRPPDMADATRRLDGVAARFHDLDTAAPIRAGGPIFVARPGEVAAATFTGAALAGEVAERAEVEEHRHVLALDGRAIDVDGAGTAIATRQYLLGARNPGRDAKDVGVALHVALDAEHTIWIDRGLGDGRVTDVARFIAPGVIVCMEPAPGDPDRDALRDVIADLRTARDANNRRVELFTVPAPFGRARGLTYCGFHLAPEHVLVPQLGAPADEQVLERLGPLFPGREVRGLPARALLAADAGFHACLLPQPQKI